jgi:hypothetical protein
MGVEWPGESPAQLRLQRWGFHLDELMSDHPIPYRGDKSRSSDEPLATVLTFHQSELRTSRSMPGLAESMVDLQRLRKQSAGRHLETNLSCVKTTGVSGHRNDVADVPQTEVCRGVKRRDFGVYTKSDNARAVS